MKFTTLILFYFITLFPIIAQNSSVQTWADYTTNNWIDENWLYLGDYGIWGFLSVEEWTQYTINPAFLYRKDSKLSYHGGIRSIYTENLNESNTFEFRPWQGIKYIWPRLKSFYIDHYFRVEERLVWQTKNTELDFSLRGRYRLRLRTLDFSLPLIPTKFTSFVSLELFMNLTERIIENYVGRNRVSFGIGNHVMKNLLIELHFLYQKSRKDKNANFESPDYIFRLIVKQNLSKGLIFN